MTPHIYKTPRIARMVFICFGLFLVADGFFLLSIPIWTSVGLITVFTSLLGFGSWGFGAIVLISTVTGHVDLYPDAIVVGSALPFWNRRLERQDIGAKTVMVIYVPAYVLYPRRKDQRKLTVGMFASQIDDYFREWMDAIPNADREFFRNRKLEKL